MTKTIPREVTREDIGWIAGIIDGEGSITFTKPRNPDAKSNRIIYGIHIVGNNKELLTKCQSIVNGLAPEQTPLKLKPKKYQPGIFKKKPYQCYQITIRRKSVLRKLLKEIIPLLTEKRLKAKKLYNYLSDWPDGKFISREQIDEYLSFTPVETERGALQ